MSKWLDGWGCFARAGTEAEWCGGRGSGKATSLLCTIRSHQVFVEAITSIGDLERCSSNVQAHTQR